MSKKIEFYKEDFPNTLNGFLNLARPFTEEEIQRADKEGLIALCVALKHKELNLQISLNKTNNLLEQVVYGGAKPCDICKGEGVFEVHYGEDSTMSDCPVCN